MSEERSCQADEMGSENRTRLQPLPALIPHQQALPQQTGQLRNESYAHPCIPE